MVTLTDEGTIDAGVFKRRQQKIYSDVLGRTVKAEVLNWQGGSVYSTVTNTYNARDQVTLARQYQGTESSGVYQETTMTFDGYGRPKTRHAPEQDAGAATTWNYNSDDTVLSVIDARGASQTLSYNNRHLVTGITYGVPTGATIPVPGAVTFAYDYAGANGKRTGQLTKILNNLNHNKDRSYTYDALGRLVQATGGPASAPLWTQTYGYDRYGNRTSVSANGYSARNRGSSPTVREGSAAIATADTGSAGVPPAAPRRSLGALDESAAPERQSLSAQQAAEPERNSSLQASTSDNQPGGSPTVREGSDFRSHHASRSAPPKPPTPQGGPPVFTDDPLVPGVTVIKAVHITELRTAVNQARSRASLPAASWAETVSSGVLIKAAHIVELRARLDEARAALGLSAASYTDPALSVGMTIKAAHVQELRQRVTEALTANFAIPVDGHANLSYDPATNRITTAGFAYDKAGNQVSALAAGGSSQYFQYDAANRLVKVRAADNQTVIASYTYGDSNERLIAEEGGLRTYYACDGSAEYTETGSSITPQWSKTYIYLGARLLSTLTPNGSGGEVIQYHHPDRLGTRLITNAQDTNSFEQVTLPFGTALTAESTGSTNRRFTTYDRSLNTGLDYAMNRHYDPQQGRFTQVDPIGMRSTSLENPQTLNLYAYCTNDPINHTDPSGLGFFSFLKKVLRIVNAVLLTIAAILQPNPYSISAAVSAWIDVFGSPRLRMIANIANNVIQSIGVRVRSSGDYWQGQEPIYDEGDVIRTTTNAPGPWWDEFLKALSSSKVNTPWLFGEWLTGRGPRSRRFDEKSVITQNLRTSPDVDTHRQRFCAQGKSHYNSSDPSYSALRFGRSAADGPLTAGLLNEGRQFVGSFELRIKSNIHGEALFVARNRTSLPSALYHIPGVPDVARGGPLQTTTQYYWWLEGRPCK